MFFCACNVNHMHFLKNSGQNVFTEKVKIDYPLLFENVSDIQKINNPVIAVSIEETSQITNEMLQFASTELKNKLISIGYTVTADEEKADIVVKGYVFAEFNTDQGYGGFFDYKAKADFKVVDKTGAHIAEYKNSVRGMALTHPEAAEASLSNCGKYAAKELSSQIISYYRQKYIVRLELYNIFNINVLADFKEKLKNIDGIKDCWITDYSNNYAYIDVYVLSGSSYDLSQWLMQTFGMKIRINRPNSMCLKAGLQ